MRYREHGTGQGTSLEPFRAKHPQGMLLSPEDRAWQKQEADLVQRCPRAAGRSHLRALLRQGDRARSRRQEMHSKGNVLREAINRALTLLVYI